MNKSDINKLRVLIGRSEPFDVILPCGAALHVKMPTAKRLLEFTYFNALIEQHSVDGQIQNDDLAEILTQVVLYILSDNHEMLEIDEEFLKQNQLLTDDLESTIAMQLGLINAFSEYVNRTSNDEDFAVPSKPGADSAQRSFADAMMDASLTVARHSGLSLQEANKLSWDIFLLVKQHAEIERLNSTPEGRQYLKDCERLATTKADYSKIQARPEFKAE